MKREYIFFTLKSLTYSMEILLGFYNAKPTCKSKKKEQNIGSRLHYIQKLYKANWKPCLSNGQVNAESSGLLWCNTKPRTIQNLKFVCPSCNANNLFQVVPIEKKIVKLLFLTQHIRLAESLHQVHKPEIDYNVYMRLLIFFFI